jgi:mannitol-1-phosphate 5-dehydrogenase
MQRKLYTYNAASAIIAYNGWNMGYLSYSDASNDEKISNILGKFYNDINHAISMEYGCDFEEQQEFALLSWKKFKDHAIKDTIERNARDPLKKLTPDERIIKPMNLLDKYGFDCSVLENAAALAILYSGLEQDFDRILNDICMISKDSCHYTNIVELINDHKNRIMDNTVHLL